MKKMPAEMPWRVPHLDSSKIPIMGKATIETTPNQNMTLFSPSVMIPYIILYTARMLDCWTPNIKVAVKIMKMRLYISQLITSLTMGNFSQVQTYSPVPSLQEAQRIASRATLMLKAKKMVKFLREIDMKPSLSRIHGEESSPFQMFLLETWM